MKTKVINLVGDPKEQLYQIGLSERESFLALEDRITKLLSTNSFLRQGQDILSRAKSFVRKKEPTLFDDCVRAYSEGMKIEHGRYQSFLSLFEIAAHYGQVYPELKAMLPGCTSLFTLDDGAVTHSRLIDFPLTGIFEETMKLYFWKSDGRPSVLSFSCEGMAPVFLHAVHESGLSLAVHHKPGKAFHKEGLGIFEIVFECLFESQGFNELRKNLRKRPSMTKWGVLAVNKDGAVQLMDLDGPSQKQQSHSLNETPELIFTNIPLQLEEAGFDSYLQFSQARQSVLKDRLSQRGKKHRLDIMTDVSPGKGKKWNYPCATLSTTGAFEINLTKGYVDVKEGSSALVESDPIFRQSLDQDGLSTPLKEAKVPTDFERGWKLAARAQASFDNGAFDEAYHQLQMAEALMTDEVWKEILAFFRYTWDFRFVANPRELSHVYKKLRKLKLPANLRDQWLLLSMRLEKRLELVPTIEASDVSVHLRPLFLQETAASRTVFNAWMKLVYPRLEVLDVFSPHQR